MKTSYLALLTLLALALPDFAKAEAPKPITISGLTFTPSADWASQESTSSMRAAELAITPEGATAPVIAVFYYFGPGQGGSVDDNVARWLKQFEGEPTQETKEHKFDGDKTVTIVSAKGTYLDGPPMSSNKTPRPGFALLGAIVPGNDADIYIKLTGPEKDVTAIAEKFTALATSPFATK